MRGHGLYYEDDLDMILEMVARKLRGLECACLADEVDSLVATAFETDSAGPFNARRMSEHQMRR